MSYRILSLDGGGSKGFYTLGVLRELEALLRKPLCEVFDLIYGTSTGAIIASLIGLGYSVKDIRLLYEKHLLKVMKCRRAAERTAALTELANQIYGEVGFGAVRSSIGIVTTDWVLERPMIFKGHPSQAHGRFNTFEPGFGVRIADAVVASCSAYPFFLRKTLTKSNGEQVELMDGGYCANNPSLYAIADAVSGIGIEPQNIRLLSVGVGAYPQPKAGLLSLMRWARYLESVKILEKTLEISAKSMEKLSEILFRDVRSVRVSDAFYQPEMATYLFEANLSMLNLLMLRGAESFASREREIAELLEVHIVHP